MTDRDEANCSLVLGELVDDAERPDTQRAKPPQPPAQRVTVQRIALEQAERILYRIDQRPVEIEQLASGAPSEDDTRHRLLRCAARVELNTKLRERYGLLARELRKTSFDRGEGL